MVLPREQTNFVIDSREYHTPAPIGPQFLWEAIPGLQTMPFMVHTRVDNCYPDIERIAGYKRKVGKDKDLDWPARMFGQFEPLRQAFRVVKWPQHMILWGRKLTVIDIRHKTATLENGEDIHWNRLLSTIPLPVLLGVLGKVSAEEVRYVGDVEPPCAPIWFQKGDYNGLMPAEVKPEDMFVNYLSSPESPMYRMTWQGDTWWAEGLKQPEGFWVGSHLRNPETFMLSPGKIYSDDWEGVQAMQKLEKFGVFCFGRFGAWSGDELLHDTYKKAVRWSSTQRWTR